jgi:hypothetical protein
LWHRISGVARYSSSFKFIKDESMGASEKLFSDSETVNEGLVRNGNLRLWEATMQCFSWLIIEEKRTDIG